MAEIYPNPRRLGDDAAAALDSSTHAMTRIVYPAYEAGPADNLYAQINRLLSETFDALAAPNGGRVMWEGGLLVGAFPYRFEIAGGQHHFEGATGHAVPANQTSYVWVDTGESLEIGAAWPGTEHRALAIVVAGASAITSVTDVRPWNIGRGSSEGWAGNAATSSIDAAGNDIVGVDEIELSDAGADASAAGRIRRNGAKVTIHDGTAAREIITTADVVTVPNGGTGLAAIAAHNLLVGDGADAASLVAPGAAGVPLCSQGPAANPAFAALGLSDTGVTLPASPLPESRGGTGCVEQFSLPFSLDAFEPGEIATGVVKRQLRIHAGCDAMITTVSLYADTAPTGLPLIVDVADDGASIFNGVWGDMPQIAAGANAGDKTLATPHSAAAGSWITIEVVQVGSGTAGGDLSIVIEGYREHRA